MGRFFHFMTPRTKLLLVAFLLVVAIVIVYFPALHYDFIGLDDDELVVRNPDIKIWNLNRIEHLVSRHYITLYIPATMLSYAIDYQIWHLTPFGFRFTNLVIHFLNALLVFYLLRLIQKNFVIALAVSLIFALHPVQIESVIWIGERKNVLSAFFFLLCVMSYWKAARSDTAQERKRLLVTLGLFLLGLLSKPSTVIFFLIVFLINHFFFNGQHYFRKRYWFYGGLLVLSLLVTGMTIFGTATEVEKYSFHGNSYLSNLFVMSTVFWKYWMLLLFPYGQNILYLSPIYTSLLAQPVFLSILGLTLFLLLLWIMRRRGNATFWFSWFVIGLLPMSNLIAPLPSIMNDRYLYIPIIGFFAGSFALLEKLSSGILFGSNFRSKFITMGGLSVLMIPFIILTLQRIPDWKTGESLWQSALVRAPRPDARIYYFYAINQLDRGNYERSVELFKTSLALHSTTDTLLALGTACAAAGKFEDGERYLKQVIEQDPKRSGAYDQLGVIYRKTKRFEEAKVVFEKAIQLQPRNAVLYNNYALFYMDIDQPERARQTWEYALQLDPDCHFALRNLVWYYYMRKQWKPAASYLLRYLKRDPNDKQMLSLIPSIENNLSPQDITVKPA